MVKLFSGSDEVQFKTTIFPDGTSQIWEIDEDLISSADETRILWLFENESELIHVCQVAQLCYDVFDTSVDLICPYLPYARQDKKVDNHLSFALKTFKDILYNAGISRIEAFDPHSKSDMIYPMQTVTPIDFFKSAIDHDLICYPDKGAVERYSRHITHPFIWCEKVRNQETGEILGLRINSDGVDLKGKSIIIVDDLCDGGMTFIKIADKLKDYKVNAVDLAVSHGIFSKGKECLHEAGIRNIFTTNSLLRNPEGFKVW